MPKRKLIKELLATVGTFGSLIALVLTVREPGSPIGNFQILLAALAVLSFALAIFVDIAHHRETTPKTLRGPRRVRDYMYNWINQGGLTAIFSRDMTWVTDDEMRELLKRKARNGDLILVLPLPIQLSEDLRKEGAEVIHYPALDYTIKSRFTIINLDSADMRVAVGRRQGKQNVVEEFDPGHPAFFMAQDLIELLRRLERQRST
jgi:hypothetical protein